MTDEPRRKRLSVGEAQAVKDPSHSHIGGMAASSLGSIRQNITRSFAGLNVENLIPKIDSAWSTT